jgi:hypothetical protein
MENTCLHDNHQLAKAVYGNNCCLFWETYKTHNTLSEQKAVLLIIKSGGI